MTGDVGRRRTGSGGGPVLAAVAVLAGVFPAAGPASAAQEGCPQAVEEQARRGWEAFRRNEIDEARGLFSRAVSRCPGHVGARTGMGYVHLRQGGARTARVLFRQVLDAAPDHVGAHVGLGLLAWRS